MRRAFKLATFLSLALLVMTTALCFRTLFASDLLHYGWPDPTNMYRHDVIVWWSGFFVLEVKKSTPATPIKYSGAPDDIDRKLHWTTQGPQEQNLWSWYW